MKKVMLLTVCFVLLCSLVYAQEWRPANQSTVTWQPVTMKIDGNPLSSGDVITYTIFVANALDTDKANAVEVATVTETTYTVTLTEEGKYFVGVRANRALVDDPSTVLQSDVAWSDDTNYASTPFGLQLYLPPAAPRFN